MNWNEIVAQCWQRGNGIGDTIIAVQRGTGVTLTFDEVRRHFVDLANQTIPTGSERAA